MAKEKELEQVEGQQLPAENKVESLIRVIRGQQGCSTVTWLSCME